MNAEMKKLIVKMQAVGKTHKVFTTEVNNKLDIEHVLKTDNTPDNRAELGRVEFRLMGATRDYEAAKAEARQAFEAALLTAED